MHTIQDRRFEALLFQYMTYLQTQIAARPLNLGGTSGAGGGIGSPVGGFIGQLPQSRVAYDTTEAADNSVPSSGQSLVHNLNRIRYRLSQLESYPVFNVQLNDILKATNVTTLNFEGGVSNILNEGSGKVTVTISGGTSGGSINIWQAGTLLTNNASVLNFDTGLTVLDMGGGQVDVRLAAIVQQGAATVASDVHTLNFAGDVSVTDLGGGVARIEVTTSGSQSSGGSITVQESDGAPAVVDVTTLVVAAGDLIDLGGGQVQIATASQASGIIDNPVMYLQLFT